MGRKLAREITMQILYQIEVNKKIDKKSIEYLLKEDEHSLNKGQIEYIDYSINNINDKLYEIDKYIDKNLDGWTLKRLGKVELSILRIAIYEMIYREDIPEEVSINEAVEMAKKYSTVESSKFINGILGGFLRSEEYKTLKQSED